MTRTISCPRTVNDLQPPPKNPKPYNFKHLPFEWTQRKSREFVLANSKHSSKAAKDCIAGKKAEPQTLIPLPKFRKKPFSWKQKAAQKRYVIACSSLEQQRKKETVIARQEKKDEDDRLAQRNNKIAVCTECHTILHRMSDHSRLACKSAFDQSKFCLSRTNKMSNIQNVENEQTSLKLQKKVREYSDRDIELEFSDVDYTFHEELETSILNSKSKILP